MKDFLEQARKLDQENPLKKFREKFELPEKTLYFAGHSLGPLPRKARAYVEEEMDSWSKLAVRGHFKKELPWTRYQDALVPGLAQILGAKEKEVVVMNTLTVNLHLLMVSFYRPNQKRFKILIENKAFPSDQYAVDSQVRFHGHDPQESVLELKSRDGFVVDEECLFETIEKNKDELALILIGNVNYLSGQKFPIERVVHLAHEYGIKVGLNLAHGAGNLLLNLHQSGLDFAVGCSYKYLNSGPGNLSWAYIHEDHLGDEKIPRFEGWWGHDKERRFIMERHFSAIPSAEAWQLSNPPILPLACMRASLEIFQETSMEVLRREGDKMTEFLEQLLKKACPDWTIITPPSRGSMICVKLPGVSQEKLKAEKVEIDFRSPDVFRITPAPLYTSYQDIFNLVQALLVVEEKT